MVSLKMKLAVFAAVGVGLIVSGITALDRMLESENLRSAYATRAGAEADGAFTRGWLPAFLPSSSYNIVEVHNIDSNEICARFEIDPAEALSLVGQLATQGFQPVSIPPPPPRRFSANHPCPFGAEAIRSVDALFRGTRSAGDPSQVAIAKDQRVVYYWSAPTSGDP